MKKYFDDIVKTICHLVSFDSSLSPSDTPSEGAPFGTRTRECLEYFLLTAQNMGFETHNYDGYAGEVIYGEGEEFAILAHLDVVPAGNGWKYPPFKGVITEGKIYGRGTTDDKGPAAISLFCLKALKDENFVPKRKFKLIVGCNEETGWACMNHYCQVAHMPDEGFTPDADFPVIYAEKGILHMRLAFPIRNAPFSALWGGSAANMVCDCAHASLSSAIPLSDLSGDCRLTLEHGTVTAYGIGAHGSTPEKGENALRALLSLFSPINSDCSYAYDVLFNDSLGMQNISDETGSLTMSPDIAEFRDGILYVTTDFRVPATHSLSEISNILKAEGIAHEIIHAQDALYNDPNGRLIRTLSSVYERVTGRPGSPIAIGGGTYARVLKNGCGFGPQEADEEVTIHQPNEYISLDKVSVLSEIYYNALKELGT